MEKEKNQFDLPDLFYFEAKNTYTGSKKALRFRIDVKGGMHVAVWRTKLCFALSEMEEEADFPLDTDGYRAMLAWLDDAYARTPEPAAKQ